MIIREAIGFDDDDEDILEKGEEGKGNNSIQKDTAVAINQPPQLTGLTEETLRRHNE